MAKKAFFLLFSSLHFNLNCQLSTFLPNFVYQREFILIVPEVLPVNRSGKMSIHILSLFQHLMTFIQHNVKHTCDTKFYKIFSPFTAFSSFIIKLFGKLIIRHIRFCANSINDAFIKNSFKQHIRTPHHRVINFSLS